MYGIGIMSGTSIDSVDTVLVEIKGFGLSTSLQVIGYNEYPINKDLKRRILHVIHENINLKELAVLNLEIGDYYVEACKVLLEKLDFPKEKLDYIACHGQTVLHDIGKIDNRSVTMQIGESSLLANAFNVEVINDFRIMDLINNGQGAPLVPYSEYILYAKDNENICLNNLGGISNVTLLVGTDLNRVRAFDTGPANMMINYATSYFYDEEFVQGGNHCANGVVDNELLSELMSNKFISKEPPKSTGRIDFGEEYTEKIIQKYHHLNPDDIIATFTMFVAKSIKINYEQFILRDTNINKIILGGGGVLNRSLVKMIKDQFKGIEVLTQEDIGFDSNSKEAVAFAILGNETIHNNPSNVLGATGASKQVVLGKITPVKKE